MNPGVQWNALYGPGGYVCDFVNQALLNHVVDSPTDMFRLEDKCG
jgi:hypothetical protein